MSDVISATDSEGEGKERTKVPRFRAPEGENIDSVKTRHPKIKQVFGGRFGTFMLDIGESEAEPVVIVEELEEALRADSRVVDLIPAEKRPAWMIVRRAHPDRQRTSFFTADGKGLMRVLRMSDPIVFSVSVPIRLQPKFRGADDVPSDVYWVAWDGITALVIWMQTTDRVPRSGGHVVIDVLRDVVRQAGYQLYDQPCSPGCDHVFAHKMLWVHQLPSGSAETTPSETHPRIIDLTVATDGPSAEVVERLFRNLAWAAFLFAEYKNLARHIRDLDSHTRQQVSLLLDAHSDALERALLPLPKRVWQGLRHWGHRKRSKALMAEIWVSMAVLETIRRDWMEAKESLETATKNDGDHLFFDLDMSDDEVAVMSQDLTFTRAAVEHVASGSMSRDVVAATLVGASAAILGGLVAAFVQAVVT